MKKFIRPIFALSVVATIVACGAAPEPKDEAKKEETKEEPKVMEAKTVAVKLPESSIMWSGSVIGGYSHEGTLALTEGSIEMKGNDITGGSFTVDMKTMTPTDENYSEDHSAEMLVGHLSTGDFFLVDSFPTASFVIKAADMTNKTITGDLTIKGITKSVTVEEVAVNAEAGEATGNLTFNRQDFGVTYVSTMKDMVISDDIELKLNLKM